MKVLIINPPAVDDVKIVREGRCMQRQEAWGTSWAPLTLSIIASILRESGFSVSLEDCSNDGISFKDLENEILTLRPGLIIVNTSTPSIDSDLKVASVSKRIDDGIKTLFFGIHVSALPGETFMSNRDVQYLVQGEPEYTVRDFALAVRDNKPLNNVKGLVYMDGDRMIVNEPRPHIDNLDELPFPSWDLINIKGYRLPISDRPFLLVLTGRGCPYRCTFCAAGTFYGKKLRLRSPQRIIDEIKFVKDKYGVNDFLFWSENSISDRQQMYDISKGLSGQVKGVKWVCNGRVDMVDEDLLRQMKEAGCWMIGYGIESGSQRILDGMKKNILIDDIQKAVEMAKKAGIEVTGHVIIGYPGETRDDIMETWRLVKNLDLDYIQVYCSVPFPGSYLYVYAKEKGWINSQDWTIFEQNFSVLDTPYISAGEVMEFREKMVKDFYFDIRRILKTLFKIRSPVEIFNLLEFSLRYFKLWVNKI